MFSFTHNRFSQSLISFLLFSPHCNGSSLEHGFFVTQQLPVEHVGSQFLVLQDQTQSFSVGRWPLISWTRESPCFCFTKKQEIISSLSIKSDDLGRKCQYGAWHRITQQIQGYLLSPLLISCLLSPPTELRPICLGPCKSPFFICSHLILTGIKRNRIITYLHNQNGL